MDPELPFFGIKPIVVEPESGRVMEGNGVSGALCLSTPWPGQARTVWGDHQRFKDTYFKQYRGLYFTGDGCRRDGQLDVVGRRLQHLLDQLQHARRQGDRLQPVPAVHELGSRRDTGELQILRRGRRDRWGRIELHGLAVLDAQRPRSSRSGSFLHLGRVEAHLSVTTAARPKLGRRCQPRPARDTRCASAAVAPRGRGTCAIRAPAPRPRLSSSRSPARCAARSASRPPRARRAWSRRPCRRTRRRRSCAGCDA